MGEYQRAYDMSQKVLRKGETLDLERDRFSPGMLKLDKVDRG